jgi:hypothetical protein
MDGQAVKKNGMYVVLRQLVDGLWIGVQPSPALEIAQKRPTFWHEDWTFGGSSGLCAGDHRIFRWMAWRRRLAWAAVFAADTTAVAGTGMLATIAGMAVGAGEAVVGTRGGCFRFQSLTLILITGGTTAQAMGMAPGYSYGRGY